MTRRAGTDSRETQVAVRIRMKRLGRKHRPYYRICVMDSRSPRDGKTIEEIGTYDPMVRDKSQRVSLKLERVDHWLSVGAQPTEKVAVLIRKFQGVGLGRNQVAPPDDPAAGKETGRGRSSRRRGECRSGRNRRSHRGSRKLSRRFPAVSAST